MITANGTVKIMDFGIAKAGGSMTSTGQVLGTPNYMSPEQVKGRPLDGRSDLFSFGVILYEMLTGEKPFVGQNVTTIIYKIVNENPIAPRDLDVTVHPNLSAIVTKALAKSPDERYQTGADLIHDLENYKVAGAPMQPTSVFNAGALNAAANPANGNGNGAGVAAAQAHEKTLVLPLKLVAGATVRAPKPEPVEKKNPVPFRRPNLKFDFSRWKLTRKNLTTIIAGVVLLGCSLGAFGYVRHRITLRRAAEEQARLRQQLEEQQRKDFEAAAAAAAASAVPKPSPDAVIARDTMVKYVKPGKPSPTTTTANAPALPSQPHQSPVKATSSPNQVYTQQSELVFSSKPVGAKVEIDGWSEPNWVTPFTASHLAAGYHTLIFTKAGYLQKSMAAESVAGKSIQLSAELVPAVSTLVITSNPAGANVWIDGKDSGQVTPAQITVEKGIHRVVVRKAGFKDATADETLAEGQTQSFSPVLLSLNQQSATVPSPTILRRIFGSDTVPEGKGLVHVRTEPEGATIIVDGKVAPRKSNARWPAEPGVYSIVLELEGYKPVHRNVKVQEGKIISVDEILEKQ
jgi:serine/threonine-protein kinase